MKRVQVMLRATLRYCTSGEHDTVLELEDHATVREILAELKIKRGEVGLVVMGGRLLEDQDAVPDGALVELYPVFGGG